MTNEEMKVVMNAAISEAETNRRVITHLELKVDELQGTLISEKQRADDLAKDLQSKDQRIKELDSEMTRRIERGEEIKFEYNKSLKDKDAEIQRLRKAVADGAHYLAFHSQGKGATEFLQMNEDAAKLLEALNAYKGGENG